MNDCEIIRDSFSLYIDEQLSPEELEQFKKHLANCADCTESLAELEDVLNSLKSLPELPLPEGFHDELMFKINQLDIDKKLNNKKTGIRRQDFSKYYGFAASIVFILVIGAFLRFFLIKPFDENGTFYATQENAHVYGTQIPVQEEAAPAQLFNPTSGESTQDTLMLKSATSDEAENGESGVPSYATTLPEDKGTQSSFLDAASTGNSFSPAIFGASILTNDYKGTVQEIVKEAENQGGYVDYPAELDVVCDVVVSVYLPQENIEALNQIIIELQEKEGRLVTNEQREMVQNGLNRTFYSIMVSVYAISE